MEPLEGRGTGEGAVGGAGVADELRAIGDGGADGDCPVTYCLSVIGGKWKPIILYLVVNGVNRFGVLQRNIDGISKQMLTRQLRELEADDVLDRHVYPEVPPRVEYTLTAKGRSLLPVIGAMRDWGQAHQAEGASEG
ncbi:MAG: helix-turn-helix domain-containing protein [Actinomycetota bacterium]